MGIYTVYLCDFLSIYAPATGPISHYQPLFKREQKKNGELKRQLPRECVMTLFCRLKESISVPSVYLTSKCIICAFNSPPFQIDLFKLYMQFYFEDYPVAL